MIFFYGFEGLINRFIKVASIELFDWMREVEYKMRRWENMWEDVRLCEKMWDMWEDKRRCEDEEMRRCEKMKIRRWENIWKNYEKL